MAARPFTLREVDVSDMNAKSWKAIYDFDVPVIHISRATSPEETPELASQALKLMHHFTFDQVREKMDEAEQS